MRNKATPAAADKFRRILRFNTRTSVLVLTERYTTGVTSPSLGPSEGTSRLQSLLVRPALLMETSSPAVRGAYRCAMHVAGGG